MKRSRPFPWGFAVVSLLAVAAIVVSLLPASGLLPAPPSATAANTKTPAPTQTPDECDPSIIQTTALDFNGIAREFDDYTAIAENIPVQDLADPIAELQRIRRSSENFQVPGCLATLKEFQLTYMNTYINAVLTLFSINTDQTLTEEEFTQVSISVNQQISLAFQYHEQYLDEMARIMGVTRVPSPTVPSGTLDPEGPLPEETATATP
ncbi:MAG: hypothetical protein M1347_06515 [Chloroflexi bacterium]|nr:hypothetical protein [Chloroflexota bacterium]